MQISTRDADFIIDTIKLRHALSCLLDPFTNPAIVKVFHGADFDVTWLQKDFSSSLSICSIPARLASFAMELFLSKLSDFFHNEKSHGDCLTVFLGGASPPATVTLSEASSSSLL